mmetsp:Transcript_1879/g.4118  ORF Transcript_1879/g.4118 Transcript_1879/m.4118 type:complete len:86 (-) Transcript_1879:354-611(-)
MAFHDWFAVVEEVGTESCNWLKQRFYGHVAYFEWICVGLSIIFCEIQSTLKKKGVCVLLVDGCDRGEECALGRDGGGWSGGICGL